MTSEHFTQAWLVGPYAGFLCNKEVFPDMENGGKGVILFSATSSIQGRGGVIHTPTQTHMATTSDLTEPLLNPDSMADVYWHLATQVKQAWTLEVDLRPLDEEFCV